MMDTPNSEATILVVDDSPTNLQILLGYLKGAGFKTRVATSGDMALEQLSLAQPDMILLDVMMPEMDGFETCRQIKTDARVRDIPVIFITALTDTKDKVAGFEAGGVDYITKPFQKEEVLMRIKTHLTIHQLQVTLAQQVAELDAFAHTVAHDLKNPLGIIATCHQLLLDNKQTEIPEDQKHLLAAAYKSGRKAINIVDELLLLAEVRKENIKRVPLAMDAVILQAVERLAPQIRETNAEVIYPDTWPVAIGYPAWIEEVWVNYLSNGLKYGGQPPRLEMGATRQPEGWIQFWVQDNGSGIAPDAQNDLFTEFARLNKVRAQGHGLGLSIVRRIIEKLGGQVGVNSVPGEGSSFYFTLKAKES